MPSLGDLVEDRSDSAGSLIIIVQQETMIAEVQMLVVRMERRHIQEMFNKESQYSLLIALIWMVGERAVSKMKLASWLAYLVVSFLAMGVTGIALSLGEVHYEFGFGQVELSVPLRHHEDRNLIFLIHCCIPSA